MKHVVAAILLGSMAFYLGFGVGCEDSNRSLNGIASGSTGSTDGNTGETGETGGAGITGDQTGDAGSETGGGTGTTGEFVENTDSSDSETCDAQDFEISFVPTRLMILQDMSSSMGASSGWGADNKWTLAKNALNSMLNIPANAAIEFGFDMFPNAATSGTCSAASPIIQDALPMAADTIEKKLNELRPNGGTPLCQALLNFNPDIVPSYAPMFMAPGAQRYLLVVSDGADTCGGENGCGGESDSGPTELRDRTTDLLNHGIRTFVIDFGENPDLNAIASAGGTGHSESINVENQDELQAALDGIAATVASCTFEIDEPDEAADPEKVNFLVDGTQIGRDDSCTQDGWRWANAEETQVEFCEGVCEQIKAGSVSNIQATFGCPTKVVVPVK